MVLVIAYFPYLLACLLTYLLTYLLAYLLACLLLFHSSHFKTRYAVSEVSK